ncbi:hypothetical protein SRIMM317S_06271 [Streptomyces rimosus subsp. rimosus]
MVPVVVVACSMYGMKFSPYTPSSSSGTAHHAVARTTPGIHHTSSDLRRGPVRESTYSRTGSSEASVEAALTPPMKGMSSAERVAARRAGVRWLVSGSRTHGSSAPGSAAADVEPMSMVKVGHSAYAAAASSRDGGEPTRSRSASRSAPQNAVVTISDIHSRSAIHTGRCTRSARA